MTGKNQDKIEVYLEIGKKKVFAGAIDWPGWCRSGRDDETALQALLEYGPRYAKVLRSSRLGFQAPEEISAFSVVERLEGTATTDFGAPDIPTSRDSAPFRESEFSRFQTLLKACWGALDQAIIEARGKELRKGPRGGGRDLEAVVRHVLGADQSYLSALGGKYKKEGSIDLDEELRGTRQAILEGLGHALRGELPEKGPRGGDRWKPRYFVRRSAWHVLDHTWELEDRIL
jgi:hypothetical protein